MSLYIILNLLKHVSLFIYRNGAKIELKKADFCQNVDEPIYKVQTLLF